MSCHVLHCACDVTPRCCPCRCYGCQVVAFNASFYELVPPRLRGVARGLVRVVGVVVALVDRGEHGRG